MGKSLIRLSKFPNYRKYYFQKECNTSLSTQLERYLPRIEYGLESVHYHYIKRLTMLIRTLICTLCFASSSYAQTSRTVPDFEVHAKAEKKNALLNFDKGAAAATVTKEQLDSIAGTTSDFPGGPVPAYIVFDESVTEEKLMQLANFQGRLKGSVQCKRIRLGDSPLFPHLKSAVLAEQCVIKSINH